MTDKITNQGNAQNIQQHLIASGTPQEKVNSDRLKTVILKSPELHLSDITLSALITSVKILFAPITLLVMLIVKSLAMIASSNGLGTDEQVKETDLHKRNKLAAMGGEAISFGLEEQAVLEGMFFRANRAPKDNKKSKTILLCTGSHQSYEYYAIPMVRSLLSMGHNVMVFNYEGFGKSCGMASEEGVYRSIDAAYQYLVQEKKCPKESIVAWGYSLGSGAVSELASKHTVDIVIDRGFSTMSEVAYSAAPTGLKTVAKMIFMIGAHFNNLRKLTTAKGRAFIAQGKHDQTMPKEIHGAYLKEVIQSNPQAIYKEVNSAHSHSDEHVWFDAGEDRHQIESFLAR